MNLGSMLIFGWVLGLGAAYIEHRFHPSAEAARNGAMMLLAATCIGGVAYGLIAEFIWPAGREG